MSENQEPDKTITHTALSMGTQIAQYRIDGLLGAGGMGEVYLAHDTRLNRNAALKFLPVHSLQDQSHRTRFAQEAQAAAKLNHPNIVTIYDIGEFEGRPFIAMEYLEGETLKALIKRKALTEESLPAIMREIANGVAAAHAGGIIHRDLKPENVMIGTDNRVKIMDFGLAFQLSSGSDLTRTGTVMGTPYYMSPEQVKGETVDQRTDIFSLGIIFYELLSGVRPFDGDYHLAVLFAIANHQPQPLEELAPFAPPELISIAMRCLAKQPGERYANGADLFADLRSIGMEQSTTSRALPKIKFATFDTGPVSNEQELVGRETLVDIVSQQLDAVLAGTGTTTVINGEAGVGKSRFASAIARLARSKKVNVLRGRCFFEEGQLPYHPFSSALKNVFIRVDEELLVGLVARGKGNGIDLTPMIPVLRSFLNISSDPVALVNKEQLWTAVLSVLNVIATERPILLIIDDLHWADKPTLALFSYLARSIASSSIMLLGLYRDEERGVEGHTDSGGLEQIVRQLRIDNLIEIIELRRFTRAETDALLRQLLDGGNIDPDLGKAVYDRSLGNPLFSNELIKLLKANNRLELANGTWRLTDTATVLPVPQRVQDVIVNRLEGIAPEQRELLEFASCEGESFPSDILVGCLKRDRIVVLKQLQTLEKEHGLIRHREHLYYFDHPLIREVLYDGILPELREEYHRLIADWLIEKHANDREYASRIARHLHASNREPEALPYLLLAATHARELHALESASGYYQRALAILNRNNKAQKGEEYLNVYEGLGDVCFLIGQADDARKWYERLLTHDRVATDRLHKAVIQRKLSDAHRILGNTQEAIAIGTEALNAVRDIGNSRELIRALNTLAFLYFNRLSDWDTALPMLTEALELAKSTDDIDGQAMSLNNLGLAHLHQGDADIAFPELEEARKLQEMTGDIRGLAQTENHLGIGYFPRGRFEDAINSLQASLDIRRRISDYNGIPGSTNGLGDAFRELGDVRRALEYHLRGLELARERNNKAAQCDNLRDLGEDYLKLGDLERSKTYLDEVIALSGSINHLWYLTRANSAYTLWSLAAGELDEADRYSQTALQMARDQAAQGLISEALWVRARVTAAKGKIAEAIALLEEAIEVARSIAFRATLWQMFADLSKLYEKVGNTERQRMAHNEARKTIDEIISFMPTQELKDIFLVTPGVRELLSD